MDTFKLVEIWGKEGIQTLLAGCMRNKQMYNKIAEGIIEEVYKKTGVQCRDQFKKLKTESKKGKDNNSEKGG